MMNSDDDSDVQPTSMNEILGIGKTPVPDNLPAPAEPTMPTQEIIPPAPVPQVNPVQIMDDYARARDNIIGVMNTANEVMALAFAVVRDKEDARTIEATNSLLKTISQTSLDLLEAHARVKAMFETKTPAGGPTTMNVQNAVFTGTPKQLKSVIEQMKASRVDSVAPAPVSSGEPVQDSPPEPASDKADC